jgi:hypothetical protein
VPLKIRNEATIFDISGHGVLDRFRALHRVHLRRVLRDSREVWRRSSGSAANRSRSGRSLCRENDEAHSRGARAAGLMSERQSAGSGRCWFEFLV